MRPWWGPRVRLTRFRASAGLLLALCLLCLWPSVPPASAFASAPAGAARLVVACPDDIPPYGFRDAKGKAAGLLPDFWRLLAAHSGLELELRPASSAEALQLVLQRQADVHAGVPLPSERQNGPGRALDERFALTRPLLDQGIGIFAAAEPVAPGLANRLLPGGLDPCVPSQASPQGNSPPATPVAGLVGDDAAAAALSASFPRLPQQLFPNLDALATALALGQVQVAAGPRLQLQQRLLALGEPGRFALVRSFPGVVLRAALRQGDQALLARLNTGLETLEPGDIQSLEENYVPSAWRRWLWLPGVVAGGVLLLLSLAVLVRARRVRALAEANSRESQLLRDNLLGEMARHRKTQELLVASIEQSPSGIVIGYADRSMAPLYNTQALRILAMDRAPAPGSPPHENSWRVYSSAGKLLSRAELPLARALRQGHVLENVEHRLVLSDGGERWILTNAAPVRDSQGKVLAGVVVFHDVTVSRQAERELARFKFFLEAGVEEVYLLRPNGVLSYVNEAVARSLGHARQELLRLPLTDIDPTLSPDGVYRLFLKVRQAPQTFETLQRTRLGGQVLKELKAFYMRFGDEEYICAFGQDVTERSRLQRELTSTRALFAASLEQAPWGIIVGDAATGQVSIANQAAAQLLGVDVGQLVGLDVNAQLPTWSFFDGQGRPVVVQQTPLGRAIETGESTRDLEVRFRVDGGPERWLLANAAPVRDAAGGIVAGILIMADITGRKLMENQLVFKALHDSLTGLPNRLLCLERLQIMLEHARKWSRVFAVAFVDLDRFKMLNDSMGHSFGDRVLLEAARRLEGGVAGRGEVCRFGGDEFVLLVDQTDNAEAAQEVIDLALAELGRPMTVDGQEVRLTASVGVVLGPTDDSPMAENILQNADLAMHRAKDSGRDRVRLFHPGMLRRAQELMALDADMRRALELEQFIVFYQPIVSADGSEILGLEALARWNSPTRGLVMPHAFISHAEDSGLIVPLGQQVLRQACATMAAWRRNYPSARRMTLAVNLSARQFSQPDLVDSVRGVLRESGLPPALLKLELTESAIMGDPESALSSMRRLKALGLSLAIDDFGTGYSSLAYLQRFPVDVLKIDRSFVRELPRADADSRALVGAIAALAGSLRLSMVAEGVETREQLDILVSLGCEAMQGYLFHPPLPEDVVTELLRKAEEDA